MNNLVTRFFVGVITLFGTLIFEVLLAMVIFTYLALNQQDLFNSFANLSDQALTATKELMRSLFPNAQDALFGGAMGDLSARAFLLLIIGLLASGLIRMIVWGVRAMFRRD